MWAALLAAIGIGVVWAGGERFEFSGELVIPGPRFPEEDALVTEGRLGGVAIYRVPFRTLVWSTFSLDPFPDSWMWRPRAHLDFWNSWTLHIPYWIPTFLCLATFALLFRVERREKRLARAGRCVCGYSLAGLAEGAVCPECGKTLT